MVKDKKIKEHIASFAFILAILLIICSYWPLLSPIFDGKLQFAFGDFKTIVGEDSAEMRKEITFYSFANGEDRRNTNRFFLFGSLSILSDHIDFSDTQFYSILILISLLLGSYGVYRLVRQFEKNTLYAAILILLLIPFYFLNLWAAERIGHIWIWFTYAVFPLFISIGISYIREKKTPYVVAYSLLFAFFGFVPHSLMYLLIIHFSLILHSFLRKDDLRFTSAFALVPIILYLLLNMPVFLVAMETQVDYPTNINTESLGYLSRYGEMLNLLAFSNNWWPQVSPAIMLEQMPYQSSRIIFGNTPFRYSSIFIFILVFSIFAFSYKKLGKDERTLSLVSVMAVLGVMFLAQGTNNPMLADIVDIIKDIGYKQLLGPFREWARISLMIPVFMVTMITCGISKIKDPRTMLGLLAILLMINIAFTPAWVYLNDKYSAKYMPDDYYEILEENIGKENKVLWIRTKTFDLKAQTQNGEYVWVGHQLANGIGSEYWYGALKGNEYSKKMLDALNINYVIKKVDLPYYEWLECKKLDYVSICKNNRDPTPVYVFEGKAEVINYTYVNPTLWKARVNASGPFMLAFAESYSDLWKAEIDGQPVKHVKMYGVMNGYEINKTGEFDIELRYALQDSFDRGLVVSAIALIACVAFLIYSRVRK